MGIKNLWSLNVDELLAADNIKQNFKKAEYEVFFPLNSQMKNIDLMLVNLKKEKHYSIQVKGSRTYEPRRSEVRRFGEGSAAWFKIDRGSIFNPPNRVNFFIFVLHNFVNGEIKKEIKTDFLIIPIADFVNVCKKKKLRKGNFFHFFIWIDNKNKRSFDFNNKNGLEIQLSKYLNNWKLLSK